ncbi:MAG: type II secretion system protein [Planctomycetota bacterium]|jgi:prepilin-type N-terminal cleavage/methylation domain-containing protein/prepilin-type processing-associated H-X9-DG protein
MTSGSQSTQTRAFTLIEILTVLSIIALLTAILVPALAVVKNMAKMTLCKSNLRQLALANQNYANDHQGYWVPGAINIDTTNLHRWYGTRPSTNDPFETDKGPLAAYLEDTRLQCPQKVQYIDLNPSHELYEEGNGGYGYNFTYVGSKIWASGLETPDSSQSAKVTEIRQPQATLLFADTAFCRYINSAPTFIRYGFIEPRWFVIDKEPSPVWDPSPSIHFRHRKRACLAWADGHVEDKKTAGYDGYNEDGLQPLQFDIGWFEPMNNSLFDLK